jgi:hypothetical protein
MYVQGVGTKATLALHVSILLLLLRVHPLWSHFWIHFTVIQPFLHSCVFGFILLKQVPVLNMFKFFIHTIFVLTLMQLCNQ